MVSGGAVTGVAVSILVRITSSATSLARPANDRNVTRFSVSVASTANHSSLAGGTVGFFIPQTNTFKQTWFNAD